jgi:hypothetical protein
MDRALAGGRKRQRKASLRASSTDDTAQSALGSKVQRRGSYAGDDDATPSFDSLPDEVLMNVLVALGDPRDLGAWAQTSHRHACLAQDDSLWRRLCESHFGPLLHDEHETWGKNWRWVYRAQAHVGVTSGRDVGAIDIHIDAFGKYVYWGDLENGQPHGYGLALKRHTPHCRDGSPIRAKGVPPSLPSSQQQDIGYQGQWHRGCMHGQGVYVFGRGRYYRGEWRNNDRHGFGISVTPDRGRYAGEWNSDKKHGHGRWTGSSERQSYVGEYAYGVRHGFGVSTHSNGACYHGQFHHGVRDGQGQYTWPNGSRYDGAWCDNKRHGHGVHLDADGTYLRGVWWHDKNKGRYVLRAPDGSYYQGECRYDLCHGRGVWTGPDGGRYDGQWKSGQRHGKGACDYPDGSRAQGAWAHDVMISGRVVWHSRSAASCHPRSPCRACAAIDSTIQSQVVPTSDAQQQQPQTD